LKIIRLNDKEIYLTYSWSLNPFHNHGICGHTFEVIDYYLLLKEYFSVGIFIGENISKLDFEIVIRDKYDLLEDEIQDILDNIIFSKRPSLLQGNKILFVDGGVSIKDYTLLFNKVFMFACGNKEASSMFPKYTVLQDYRIYGNGVNTNTIDYIKKINFNRYKKSVKKGDKYLIYGTKNCRAISDFSQYSKYNNILCLVSELPNDDIDGIDFKLLPYYNLFNEFHTYIYTTVPRHFDCSPRFIAECHFYNKKVIYDIDYTDDIGLNTRRNDIDTNFLSLYLDKNDIIMEILKG
jgi:hypothetical protein